MALTLEEANRIAQGAVAKAKELNIRVSVAVCDAGEEECLVTAEIDLDRIRRVRRILPSLSHIRSDVYEKYSSKRALR